MDALPSSMATVRLVRWGLEALFSPSSSTSACVSAGSSALLITSSSMLTRISKCAIVDSSFFLSVAALSCVICSSCLPCRSMFLSLLSHMILALSYSD